VEGRFFLIHDLRRLLGTQLAPRRRGRLHICRACLLHFTTQEYLQEHLVGCGGNSATVPVPIVQLSESAVERMNVLLRPRRKRRKSSDLLYKCWICLRRPRDALYLPCKHLICCQSCAQKNANYSTKCMICRGTVTSIEHIYLS